MFKKILPLSAILSLRFLGLFLVLPIISVYALSMEGATPLLVGVVVGGYALTQALFQMPFGSMSDKIGRKVTLFIGLLIFLVGSIICALSDSIYLLILGRFLQGAGAIGSVVTAMISDLVEEEVRAKAMAMMGGTIAMSFALAMVLGPVLGAAFGLDVLFWITALFALLAIALLFTKVPTPPRIKHFYEHKSSMVQILKDRNLFNMIVINAMQKGLMSAAFVLIPIYLTQAPYGWLKSELYMAYVPAMILGLLAMGPAAVFGEKYNKPKLIFLISIALFFAAFLLFALSTQAWQFVVGVVCFFIAFNMMEPLVQSMISKYAKVHQKGAALGLANGIAYFMTFVGATLTGLFLDSTTYLYVLMGVIALWFIMTLRMQNPKKYAHLYINHDDVNMQTLKSLEHQDIAEWYINENEALVVVKYVKESIDPEALKSQICAK